MDDLSTRRRFLRHLLLLGGAAVVGPVYAARAQRPRPARSPRDEENLLTLPVYDERFDSVSNNDRVVAAALFPLSLQAAWGTVIPTTHTEDIAVMLGIDAVSGLVGFERGMYLMWEQKLRRVQEPALRRSLVRRQEHFMRAMSTGGRSDLLGYRAEHLDTYAQAWLDAFYAKRREDIRYRSSRRALDFVVEHITPNVLLSYSVQELFPGRYMGELINPVFKTWMMDRLLREAGPTYVEGMPARYDALMSYGPYQLTDYAVTGVATMINRYGYGKADERFPAEVEDFQHLRQHVAAAVVFAYTNWEGLVGHLRQEGLLRSWLQKMEAADLRERQIFMAGITACMHHQPSPTRRFVAEFFRQDDTDGVHHRLPTYMQERSGAQLAKYYRSSAEAYLIMKVFDVLQADYGA